MLLLVQLFVNLALAALIAVNAIASYNPDQAYQRAREQANCPARTEYICRDDGTLVQSCRCEPDRTALQP